MSLKQGFRRFLAQAPDRLHFAAHSHHPWPDVAYDGHVEYWEDSSRMVDDKWSHIFGTIVPDTRRLVASVLGLEDPETLTFGPNTHDFLVRLASCIEPPLRILSSDAEFHSFTRQTRRWEEAGLAIVDRVPAEPFDDFAQRFARMASSGAHDMVYLSSVFFDSGYPVDQIEELIAATPDDGSFWVVDGYHEFMARPMDLGPVADRAFYLAGGYKYAMAGEGVCFLHAPHGYGERPVDTGWYAGFGQLESGVGERVAYARDGSRFAGATYDPSGIYRLRSVLRWLEDEGMDVAAIHRHVVSLHDHFLESAPHPGELIPGRGAERGNFLTFRTERAGELYDALHAKAVITDYRGDRLRLGFGIYHDQEDVDRLIDIFDTIV